MRSREAADCRVCSSDCLLRWCQADIRPCILLRTCRVKFEFSQTFLSTESLKWLFMHFYAFYSIAGGREREGDGREGWEMTCNEGPHLKANCVSRSAAFPTQHVCSTSFCTGKYCSHYKAHHSLQKRTVLVHIRTYLQHVTLWVWSR